MAVTFQCELSVNGDKAKALLKKASGNPRRAMWSFDGERIFENLRLNLFLFCPIIENESEGFV